MILRAIVAGAVILVLGAALFLVSIPGQSVTTQGADSTYPATFWEPSVTPETITFSVSWASPSPVAVSVYSCGTDTSCSAESAYEIPSQLVAQGTAAIGTLNFTGVAGDGYEVYASSGVTVNVVYNGPLFGGVVGLLFLIVGAIALVAGAAVPAGGLRPPSPVKDAVLRQPGEVLRWYWNGSWDGGAPGGLLLTSQRLVLLDRRDVPGGIHISTRENLDLKDLVAAEPSAVIEGPGQLVLKTAQGPPRTFAIEGRFTARRAARAIQRARAFRMQPTGGPKGARPASGLTPGGVAAGAPPYSPTPGSEPVIYHEREVVREVVKIPCRYCGQLNDQLAPKCSSCGALTGRS